MSSADKPPPSRPRGPGPSPSLTSSARQDALVGRKVQDYVIQARVGVGGMGYVYRAIHPLIGKHVAVKVLRGDVGMDARDMDRLMEEARVVNSIKHRGIISIFAGGTLEDGRQYLVMELLEGESLEQRLAREGRLPAAEVAGILEEVVSALGAAHQAGIVHRDLKPANVFLVKESGQQYVKLLDFGLARRHQAQFTRIAGTPDYISPEHARGKPAGPPSDMYGVGVLAFHMLTGQLPYVGKTPMEVMEQHVHRPPPLAHEVSPDVPRPLSELIARLMAKDPAQRPDAAHTRADLKAVQKVLRSASTQPSLKKVAPVEGGPLRPWVLGALALGALLAGTLLAVVLWPARPAPTLPVVTRKELPGPTPTPPPPLARAAEVAPLEQSAPDAGAEEPPSDAGQGEAAGAPENAQEVWTADSLDETAGGLIAADIRGGDAGQRAALDDAPLDDFTLGELKRDKRLGERLESIGAVLERDARKRLRFTQEYQQVRQQVESALSRRAVAFAEDDLLELERAFWKD